MPITAVEARSIAEREISRNPQSDGELVEIVDEHTIERSWGWVYFYQSSRDLETDDYRFALGGNAPVIVEREC